MNTNFAILQEQDRYWPLSEPELNTIEALCLVAGMPFPRQRISEVAMTLPVYLQREFLSLSRLVQGYRSVISSESSNFTLTAAILENAVTIIDQHSSWYLGFYWNEKLRQECQLIAQPIFLNSPMEELCRPLQTYFANFTSIQCRIIGAVLFLFLIRRICIGHPECQDSDIDWSNMIRAVNNSPDILSIPIIINEKGIEITNQMKIEKDQLISMRYEILAEINNYLGRKA